VSTPEPPSQPPSLPPQSPGATIQPGRPPAPYSQTGVGPVSYPVQFDADYPQAGIARWRPLVQGWLLPIPHWIALFFVLIAAYCVVIVSWFAVLITGKYPEGMFNFVAGAFRWTNRVTAYSYLMTEEYPPFSLGEEPQFPIRTHFQYPPKIARWRPLVQWLAAIPHFVALWFVAIGAFITFVISWFAILFTRTYPEGLYNFFAGYMRWNTRVLAYYLWMTEEYPPFGLN
jgi:hypothetical protein